MRKLLIKIPIYKYNIYVVYSPDILKSRARYNVQIGGPYKGGLVDGLHSYNEDSPDSYIFISPSSSIGTIAHECSHAIWQMFNFIGAEMDNENFAYHLGYILDKILEWKQLRKKS